MDRQVAVVIVNWNNWSDTATCLARLRQVTLDDGARSVRLHAIVVDNGSSDDSVYRLRKLDDITLLPLPENRGFAAGSNVGIRKALTMGCDFVLLLNNDAYGAPDFLLRLLETADVHAACAVVCPKILYAPATEGDSPRIWYAGGRFHRPRLIGEMVGMDEIDVGQYQTARPVDFAVGCCMLIDTRLFADIGLLDEAFFFYQEDVDFSYRATLAGHQVWYQPAALLWHHVSSSTASDLPRRTYLYAMSRPVFFVKHIRGIQWLPVLALESIRLLRHVANAILQRQPRHGWAYLRGMVAGWQRALFSQRRRQTQQPGSQA